MKKFLKKIFLFVCFVNVFVNNVKKGTAHCHLTGEYKGPAHEENNTNVKQNQVIFILFAFQNFSRFGCHLFLKKLIKRKIV